MATLALFILGIILEMGVSALEITLSNSGHAVRGSNVTFTASITSGYTGKSLKYVFLDDATPQHNTEFMSTNQTVDWSVNYDRSKYEAGQYQVTLTVLEYDFILWITVAREYTAFNLTDTLHGSLVLNQNEIERPNDFVAVNQTVTHFVKLPDSELDFLKKNSSSIITYWFKDCELIDTTNGFYLNYTYTDVMNSHDIEAIVVANHKPLPPLTTTTTSTTTTTTTTTTTPKPNTTSILPPTSSLVSTSSPPATSTPTSTSQTKSNSLSATTNSSSQPSILPQQTSHENSFNSSSTTVATKKLVIDESTLPQHSVKKRAISNRTIKKGLKEACHNTVPIDEGHSMGRYQKNISVREPISSVNITGRNWLQHGDLLRLDVEYTGSPPFYYCILYENGQYNITGNETCTKKEYTETKTFPFVHYFPDSDQHTVVVVIENELGKKLSKSTINIYKVTVHAQLSVIVVPVFFSLVAVIMVVFGVAYYQHRSRHVIEVADFDFGQAHLDYKTFTERLRDSFSNAFNFRHREDTDPLTTNTRYDSMT